MESALIMLAAALLLDGLLGEYPRLLHPVVWLGTLVSGLLRLAPRRGWWAQFTFGTVLAILVPGLSVGVVLLVMELTASVPIVQLVIGTFFLKASFALRELGAASYRVLRLLEKGDQGGARLALRSLCSRDPANLAQEELIAATIESMAENTSDSFVAPLFYYLLFGVAGAVGYRAINTLDAMVGYRGQYEALGKASARFDDLVNWIPARLTAGLLLLGGWLCGNNCSEGWRILRRDGANTPSPNGGRPMAVMAGLLGVQLIKRNVYILGEVRQPLTTARAQMAWRVVVSAAALMVVLCGLGLVGIYHLRSYLVAG
jgi:adenosylcobinamide-phosphate synthase